MSPILGARGGLSASAYGFTSAAAAVGDYESIQTYTVGAGGSATIDFTSISSAYKHLQLRLMMRSTTAAVDTDDLWLRFNSDTGSNYSRHILQGDGSTASAGANTSQTRIPFGNAIPRASSAANVFGVAVIDILDYTSSNKNKTVRGLYGSNENSTSTNFRVGFNSGLWYATPAAITSITLQPEANSFAQYSSFALYGVK
jgi:hypothetical protein